MKKWILLLLVLVKIIILLLILLLLLYSHNYALNLTTHCAPFTHKQKLWESVHHQKWKCNFKCNLDRFDLIFNNLTVLQLFQSSIKLLIWRCEEPCSYLGGNEMSSSCRRSLNTDSSLSNSKSWRQTQKQRESQCRCTT